MTSTVRQPPVLRLNLGLEQCAQEQPGEHSMAVSACVGGCVTGVPGPSRTAMAVMDGLVSPFSFSLGVLIWSQSQPWIVVPFMLQCQSLHHIASPVGAWKLGFCVSLIDSFFGHCKYPIYEKGSLFFLQPASLTCYRYKSLGLSLLS